MKTQDLIIQNLIAVCSVLAIILFVTWSANVKAAKNPQHVTCEQPTQREDETPLAIGEIKENKIYCGRSSGDYGTAITVDKSCDYTFDLPEGENHCAVTTVDVSGRESIHSNEIILNVDPPVVVIDLVKPLPGEFTLTRIGDTFTYTLNITPPTKDEAGNDIPANLISKHYLFINGKWGGLGNKGDITPDMLPHVVTLTEGRHGIQIESEIAIDGENLSSNKTPVLVVDVQKVIIQPDPPSNFKELIVPIPEGATELIFHYRISPDVGN